jgi:hypothetical protein
MSLTIALLVAGPFPSGRAATTPVQATAETGDYRLEPHIGDREQMYSETDAERLKPISGEIMVSGQTAGGIGDMEGMSGMSPGGSMQTDPAMRHLELHVRSKATGRAVRDVNVGVIIADAAGSQQMVVPIAAIYGISEGQDDWHYGNNIRLLPGHYVVLISANREAARFDVTIADK